MKPEDFAKSLDFLLDALLRWVACLRNPAATARDILRVAADPNDAFKRAISVWITATVLALLVRGWAYQLHGIGMGNMTFLLTSTLLQLGVLLSLVLCMQLVFRVARIEIAFADTFVAYTVHISALAPFIALLYSPLLAQTLARLKSLKAGGGSLEQVLAQYFAASADPDASGLAAVVTISHVLALYLFYVMFALVLRFLAGRCKAPRRAVFSRGSLGLIVGLVPSALWSLINLLVMYSFL